MTHNNLFRTTAFLTALAVGAIAQPPVARAEKVSLPSDKLAAGVPGTGPVSLEEIKKWLADSKNHETLEVALPEGLSLGQSQISGLDKNPLTRAKIELGRQLYFDTRLSADNTISCASCHHPDDGYARHTQFGVGIGGQMGGRNSPVSYNRILSSLQFWDGRADVLEADKGIVDVYWLRKSAASDQLVDLGEEKNRLLEELDGQFRIVRENLE